MPKHPRPASLLVLGAVLLATAGPAGAKGGFRPGDLRLCSETACVTITGKKLLAGLSRFSFGRPEPAVVHAPRLGAGYLQLKSSDGNVTGIAATNRLDRFRSRYGTPQFGPDQWYRVPASVARALQALASGLPPLRVTPSTIGRTRYG